MRPVTSTLVWLSLFAIAFAYVESSVVVYLRALYYPEGFTFPLKIMTLHHIGVELGREAATIVMLAASGIVAGTSRWSRFGYFLVAFGVWDFFYYVWLKVLLDWPGSILEWDVLFLIPLPWISPVIAPVSIAILMIVIGVLLVRRIHNGAGFNPGRLSWSMSLSATALALFSFIYDVDATLHGATPKPYRYEILIAALSLYTISFVKACNPPSRNRA